VTRARALHLCMSRPVVMAFIFLFGWSIGGGGEWEACIFFLTRWLTMYGV